MIKNNITVIGTFQGGYNDKNQLLLISTSRMSEKRNKFIDDSASYFVFIDEKQKRDMKIYLKYKIRGTLSLCSDNKMIITPHELVLVS